jgi:hypothetical protein
MNNELTDFELFATAANYLKPVIENKKPEWENSPFKWILELPSATKGKLGVKLVQQWCALKDLEINKSPDSEADLLINDHRAEVKFSTLWRTGIYKFQQIRDQDYEYAICLGISPHSAHCWVIDKKTLKEYVIGHLGQHTGREGKDTAWFQIDPSSPPEWLNGKGGSLQEAFKVLEKLSKKQ